MKEIKKEKISYTINYQATDGTLFTDRAECEKYENSALGVMRGRFNNLIVADTRGKEGINAWTLMGGDEDHDIVAIKMSEEKDYNDVCQLLLLESPWLDDERHVEFKQKRMKIIQDAFENNDIVFFGINCEGYIYLINSLGNIMQNLKDFCGK